MHIHIHVVDSQLKLLNGEWLTSLQQKIRVIYIRDIFLIVRILDTDKPCHKILFFTKILFTAATRCGSNNFSYVERGNYFFLENGSMN